MLQYIYFFFSKIKTVYLPNLLVNIYLKYSLKIAVQFTQKSICYNTIYVLIVFHCAHILSCNLSVFISKLWTFQACWIWVTLHLPEDEWLFIFLSHMAEACEENQQFLLKLSRRRDSYTPPQEFRIIELHCLVDVVAWPGCQDPIGVHDKFW